MRNLFVFTGSAHSFNNTFRYREDEGNIGTAHVDCIRVRVLQTRAGQEYEFLIISVRLFGDGSFGVVRADFHLKGLT